MPPFTNEPIDIDQLPRFESISLTKPHPNYWKVIVINITLFLLITGGSLLALILTDLEFRANLYLITACYLVFGLLLFIIYRASFKKRGFALRDKDVIYKSGIIAETTTIVPLNRIQHVALDEGIFSRMFKLGKLQIFTAGGQSGHLKIGGIEIDKARNMKDAILGKLNQLDHLTES